MPEGCVMIARSAALVRLHDQKQLRLPDARIDSGLCAQPYRQIDPHRNTYD